MPAIYLMLSTVINQNLLLITLVDYFRAKNYFNGNIMPVRLYLGETGPCIFNPNKA